MAIKNIIKSFKITNFIFLTIAGIINAIGVTMFLAPVNLYDSGISGTSILLSQITPAYLTLSIFLIILNVPLFLYGLKRQGGTFTCYAIYTISIYSLSAYLITDVLPVDVSIASPLAGQDLLLCAIFGGLISGIGSGMAIRFGGAMDGIEVMAVIFAKRLGITVGTFVMIYNIALYVISGIILNSWILHMKRRNLLQMMFAKENEIGQQIIKTVQCFTGPMPSPVFLRRNALHTMYRTVWWEA